VRHASFFSGVGGLDLGLERAGIRTVSLSEIDPYACAVLAERFPDAPNLGSITEVEANDIPEADIWSGGFPCQDLSLAGKRAGFAGKRSSLAFTFLDLAERRRPRWLLLENVPGLFSSNKGADFGRLLSEMEQLGYGVSWRTLDARYFGVAQRRRRVFIIGSLESDRAGEVLLECEGCERHPSPRQPKGESSTSGAPDGSGIAGAITRRFSKGVNSTIDEPLIIGPATDPHGMRAADGLARRLDNQPEVEAKGMRIGSFAQYVDDGTAASLRAAGGDIGGGSENLSVLLNSDEEQEDQDQLLPLGLDSHRYRCCGNGVVAPVAEWIGRRIVEVDRRWREGEGE
jgi:DNA (cytosine-5)-methyltransferase 1